MLKPKVFLKYALLCRVIWAVIFIVLRMTVLSGISEGFYPAIFFVSLELYLPGLIFIGMDTARYYDYMERTHRNFIEDKWNEWSWGGAFRFLFSDRESGDPNLITIKKTARLVVMIAIFGFLPIFTGNYAIFFMLNLN